MSRPATDPTLFELDPLPSERCPGCGRARSVVLWSQDTVDGSQRTYRCTVCLKEFSVDGREQSFAFLDEAPVLDLVLEG